MAHSKSDRKIPTVQTTDATVTSLLAETLVDDEIVTVIGTVMAFQSDQTNGKMFYVCGAARKDGVAAAVLLGASVQIITAQGDAGFAAVTVVLDVSSPDLRVRITGIAATTINWIGDFQILRRLP